MSRYLLDTNVLIHFFTGNYEAIEIKISKSIADIAISTVSIAELYEGYAYRGRRPKEVELFLKEFGGEEHLLAFDWRAAEQYFYLKRKAFHPSGRRKRLNRKLASAEQIKQQKALRPDHFIAAIAKSNKLILVTENTKDFKVFGPYLPVLNVHDWASAA